MSKRSKRNRRALELRITHRVLRRERQATQVATCPPAVVQHPEADQGEAAVLYDQAESALAAGDEAQAKLCISRLVEVLS